MKWIDKVLTKSILPLIPRAVKPNHITLFRISLTPLIGWLLYTEQFIWGGILFAFLAVTDSIDGAMARSQNQISRWGKIYDPLADKLLIGIAVLILITKYISSWLAWSIISIDAILLIQGGYQSYKLNRDVQANNWGKAKMVLQSLGIMLLILGISSKTAILISSAEYVLYAALASAVISLFKYSIK